MAKLTSLLRQHCVALLALFVALGGTSYAAIKLPKNSVGSAQIKSGAVNTSEIRNGAVKNGDLGSGAVTGSKIKGNSVTSSKIKPGSLLLSDFKAGELPKAGTTPTTLPPSGTAGGALSGTYPNPGLADASVTGSKIADGSIVASKLGKLPAIRLKFATGGIQSIPNNPTTAQSGIQYPTAGTATQYANGGFTTGTDGASGATTLNVPVSGVYTVTATVLWLDPTLTVVGPPQQLFDDGNGERTIFINGAQPGGVRGSQTVPAATGTQTRQTLSVTDYFNAGETISASVAQNSGGSLDIRGSQNQQALSATLLTP